MEEVFLPLFLHLSSFPQMAPEQSKHSSGHITALCASYGVLVGHQGPSRPHSTFCSFASSLSSRAWSVCSLVPRQRTDSCLRGFVHLLRLTWRTQPCHPSTPPTSPFWPVASPLPGLGSVIDTLGSLPWQQPCCYQWAELRASPLGPRTPGFSLAQHLYSVVLKSFSVCVC